MVSSTLRVFGCQVWYKTENAGKFDRRGRKGIFVGYPVNKKGYRKKGYRIMDEATKKVIVSRDVSFQEPHQQKEEPDYDDLHSSPKNEPEPVKIDESQHYNQPAPVVLRRSLRLQKKQTARSAEELKRRWKRTYSV